MSALTQRVPDAEATLVEFPGLVRDARAALAMLGAPAAAPPRPASGATLHLRLRPEDPLSHPLAAERQPARGWLLRVAQPAARDGHGPGPAAAHGADARAGAAGAACGESGAEGGVGVGPGAARAALVARVQAAFRFTGLADMQYAACDARLPEERVRAPRAGSGRRAF